VAHSHRTFVSYIDKSREYYAAQGYEQPYRWASNSETSFSPFVKALSECRVGLVTTTKQAADDPLEPYSAPSHPQPLAMATDHLYWHKGATTTEDVGSFLPLAHLRSLADDGVIGSVSRRFAGIPTLYSQRRTISWADHVLDTCRENDVDLAVLIPL
jgi:hypothetical protein